MLRLLLEHAGEVVTPEQIQETLWPGGTVVDFNHGIATALRKLRRTLNDDASHPRFIETLARRGYRWIAGVEWDGAGQRPESQIPPETTDSSAAPPPSVNLSAGKDVDGSGEALAEEILHAVTHILERDRTRRRVDTSPPTEMKVHHASSDITIVEISGRLNLGDSLIAMESSIRGLIEEGACKIVIDLASLKSIDSSGIGLLVASNGHIEQKGGRMRIAGARGIVAKALGIVHMDRIAPLDPDVDSSCRHLTG